MRAASLRCWVADPSMLPPRRGSSNVTSSGGATPIFNGRSPSWACPSVRTGMRSTASCRRRSRLSALLRGPRRPACTTDSRRKSAVAAELPPRTCGSRRYGNASGDVRSERRTSTSTFDIEMLPADNGDCLWIEYGDP